MNKTILIGEIANKIITTTRTSGLTDSIPIETDQSGYFYVEGSLLTYNTVDRHLKMYVRPEIIKPTSYESNNTIHLDGYICKSPIYRTTPNGREICDLLLANDPSNYIPCIAWGKNARLASQLKIGSKVEIEGRIQSRDYLKGDEPKKAYEVSINEIREE